MIINVRGSHGTGKTFLLRKIIKHFGVKKTIRRGKRIVGYLLNRKKKLYVIGKYADANPRGGGCDDFVSYKEFYSENYNQADLICDFIRKRALKGDIIFEGIVVSGGRNRWIALAKELEPTPYIFAVLDTPLKRCVTRVNMRRKAGGREPLEDLFHVEKKHQSLQSNKENIRKAGCDVRTLPHKKAFKKIMKWLRRDGDSKHSE